MLKWFVLFLFNTETMACYFYILCSQQKEIYYYGSSDDPDRRLPHHNNESKDLPGDIDLRTSCIDTNSKPEKTPKPLNGWSKGGRVRRWRSCLSMGLSILRIISDLFPSLLQSNRLLHRLEKLALPVALHLSIQKLKHVRKKSDINLKILFWKFFTRPVLHLEKAVVYDDVALCGKHWRFLV